MTAAQHADSATAAPPADARGFVETAKSGLADGRAKLLARLAQGAGVETLIGEYRALVDALLVDAWRLTLPADASLALLATGGYGRGELYPHSDIDILLCADETAQQAHADAIGRFFSLLWDSGLKLSQAVRSMPQCLQESRGDASTYTALLETRFLAGDATLAKALESAVRAPDVVAARDYFEAKRLEQRQRHARFHNTADNLEPNLKEGPGGLRDFHTLNWLAKKLYGVPSLAGLVPIGLLGEAEWQALQRNWRIVARLRFGLHLLVKRPEERLLFDHQQRLAECLGLRDTDGNLAVEQLMQDFFRSAAILLRINDRLLQRFEEHLAGEQVLVAIDERFVLKNGYLLAVDNRFDRHGLAAVFALFAVWGRLADCKGLHSDTARGLAESLSGIQPYHQQPKAVCDAFLALIGEPGGVQSLQRLARLGILARYLPAFGQVTGRMQYDLFHVYTVDQHTLNVLEFIRRFQSGRQDGFTLPHEVFPRLRKPHLLWLAGLFHDIGKGRGGDHAELGADDFLPFAEAHGLSAADTQLVEWLVRRHLLMSMTAQKSDISDPEVIQAFARQVADREHLDYLYVLTCADIAGTSPKLWNAFKDQLLADLYIATRYALRIGLEHALNAADIRRETRDMALAKLMDAGFDADAIDALWASFPEDAFLRYRPDQLVWQTQGILAQAGAGTLVQVREFGGRDSLEIFLRTPDRDGIFSGLMATLDRLNLGVQHARLLAANDGQVLDNIIATKGSHAPDAKRIGQTLLAALKDPASIRPAKHMLPRQLRHFKTPTRIEFSASPLPDRTLLSIVCADRPGLLADIAYALLQSKVRVHDARIATFGERAEDLFTISDRDDRAITDDQALQSIRDALLDYLEGRKK